MYEQPIEPDKADRPSHAAISNDALTVLAAGVAHEVRNPLTGAKSLLYTLRQTIKGNFALENQVEAIDKDLNRIEKVIHELQVYARPAELELTSVSLKELCQELSEQMKDDFHKAKVTLGLDMNALYPVIVDRIQIKDALTAILMNALEASVEGGHVQMGLVSCQFQGPRSKIPCVAVVIKNDGAGIAKDHQQRIFEPFFTTKERNTGLGLAICLGIITRHQGELHVDSKPSEGTCFSIKLPVGKMTI